MMDKELNSLKSNDAPEQPPFELWVLGLILVLFLALLTQVNNGVQSAQETKVVDHRVDPLGGQTSGRPPVGSRTPEIGN